MAFENLKSTGIAYLLEKLKDYFLQIKDAVKSVNGIEPGSDGNISIESVPYAENLISDSIQTSNASFILRTAGGTASIESGDAWLMSIKGNSVHDGFVAEQLSYVCNNEDLTVTLDRDTFVTMVDQSGTITLTYTTSWSSDLANYGLTVEGTPVNGDTIVITYVKEERGIIYQSNPQAFRSTGWNLYNYTDGYARVVKYSDTFGFRVEGTYTALQYSATLTGAKTSVTVTDGNFAIAADGYIWVTGGNSSDTAIYMTWIDWTEEANGGTFAAYSETEIDLSPLSNGENCPFPYGLLNVGSVSDEVNINLGTATKRVERLAYNATNLTAAKNSGREYEYDTDYIYLALATPETVSVSIDGSFVADDHGIEIFDETDVPVTVQILYGSNLRNKLERDVLTISSDLVNNLTTNDAQKALTAAQGKVLNDKISVIGTILTGTNATSLSVANETYSDICTVTVTPGKWVIVGGHRWETNFTGVCAGSIRYGTGTDTLPGTTTRYNVGNGGGVNMTGILSCSENTSVRLTAYQNSGSAKTASYVSLKAIKIA